MCVGFRAATHAPARSHCVSDFLRDAFGDADGVGNGERDGVPAIVMAIHTFGESLDFHPHFHALVAKMQVNRSGDSILYRSGMNAKIKCNFQVFTACDFVASTIAIIPTLIAAGRVAHEAMTAIKSGSL